jgi:hypothetical protein
MKPLVKELPFFLKKHAVLTAKISSFFLWESQSKDQWIPLHSFALSHFIPTCGPCHRARKEGIHGWKDALLDHLFSYILEEILHLFIPSLPSVALFSLACSSKSPLQSCYPWLSNSSVTSSTVTSSNPAYCSCQLKLSTLLSTAQILWSHV